MIRGMNLADHIREQGGTATLNCAVLSAVACRAECSPGTLYMIARGHKNASPILANRIEQATRGAVTKHDLRPDVFGPAPNAEAEPAAEQLGAG